jgi:lysyl-tRNA synthetase class 2
VTQASERSFVELARRDKLPALERLGVRPYAYRFDRSHTARQALELYRDDMGDHGPEVTVAGRIAAWRPKGKVIFGHVEDASGRIQVYLRKDELSESAWQLVDLLDLDDHVGVRGRLMRTKTGEVTLRGAEVELLAKALRPLPRGKSQVQEDGSVRTFHDVHDPEFRFRQRYADLAVHPEVREIFRLRAKAISFLRRYLEERGFLEVETPILQPLYGGAAARPFVTHHNTLDTTPYLRIADELYLKRLIVGGLERVYEIGHDFRNEGMDRTHNPEFTMLECYQAYADYQDIMELTEGMVSGVIQHCCNTMVLERNNQVLDFTPPWRRVRFLDVFTETTGLDLRATSEADLRAVLLRKGEPEAGVAKLAGARLVDEVFKVYVEPTLQRPTFLMDYPKPLSPLAKEHREDPFLTERFELFVQGKELANAFSELNDPDDQRRRFEDQLKQKDAGDEETQPLDTDYIRALEYGMPPTGGLGMGLDRLMMIIAEQPTIKNVILFPAMGPETPEGGAGS